MNMDKNIQEIPIEDIIPNRFQPRLSFNEEGLNELSDSIKQHGIIQPLVVRKLGDKYEIIAGERRYKAATAAGLTKVPVIVSDIDDNKSAEVALVENIQRRNLTAIEEAKSYKNLLDRGYLTQDQLASKMGVSQGSISNKLRLLNLDNEVQDALLNEKISERHARALLILDSKEEQKKWLKRILDERMTVRQLDMELKQLQGDNSEDDEGIPLVNINPNLEDIVNNAEDIQIERAPHNVANMLIPEGGIKEEPKEIETENKPASKFFNFLEDEQANMNVEIEEILPIPTPEVQTKVQPEPVQPIEPVIEEPKYTPNTQEQQFIHPIAPEPIQTPAPDLSNPSEFMDDLDIFTTTPKLEPLNETIPPQTGIFSANPDLNPIEVTEPAPIQLETITPTINTIEEITPANIETLNETDAATIEPFKTIFFNSNEEKQQPITPEPIVTNNIIEEVAPIIEEKIVDPMDSVITLEPDYAQKQEELAGTDLKTAINTVRETITKLEERGFVVEKEEADLEELYHITIKIFKK